MTPQDKVISYDLAKQIHEVAKKKGIELPESEWWWVKFKGKFRLMTDINKLSNYFLDGDSVASWMEAGVLNHCGFIKGAWQDENVGHPAFPAYDTTELLEMLPYVVKTKVHKDVKRFALLKEWKYKKSSNEYVRDKLVYRAGYKILRFYRVFEDKSPTEALGKLLLYLLENDLVKSLGREIK